MGSAPRGPGAKMIVTKEGERYGTIGGWSIEKFIVEKALQSLREGKPGTVDLEITERTMNKTGLACGGKVTVFIDVIKPKPELIIFGGSYLGKTLAEIGHFVGFKVTVIDEKKEIANREEFPFANVIWGEYGEAARKIDVSHGSYVVITLGEIEPSIRIIKMIMEKKPRYIGMIGSRNRVRVTLKKLQDEGVATRELGSLHAPVGIDIGAETPEEIAVSIIAEIIREMRTPS